MKLRAGRLAGWKTREKDRENDKREYLKMDMSGEMVKR
jgi:hypothetical protein